MFGSKGRDRERESLSGRINRGPDTRTMQPFPGAERGVVFEVGVPSAERARRFLPNCRSNNRPNFSSVVVKHWKLYLRSISFNQRIVDSRDFVPSDFISSHFSRILFLDEIRRVSLNCFVKDSNLRPLSSLHVYSFYFVWELESFCWKFYLLRSHKKSSIFCFFFFCFSSEIFSRDYANLGIVKNCLVERGRLEGS